LNKKFVLDTNVILSDPLCIYKFEDNEIHIPLIVIEEVDRHKKGQEEKARNARAFSREIDSLREQGKLSEGVELRTGGRLFLTVIKSENDVPLGLDLSINDDLILYTAFKIGAIVVSQDLNVRLKADAINVVAETYEAGKVKVENDTLYSGYKVEYFDTEDMCNFRSSKFLAFDNEFDNEYIILKDSGNPKSSALGRYSKNKGGIVPLINSDNTWGINPKNAEQRFALDALLNDDIKLVSLIGKAGTGKTLLAVAAGLNKTIESGVYKRMLISRPIVPMGKDIGYLPGDIKEKLDPWMQPIYDNLDHLFGEHGEDNQQWKGLLERGIIKIEALTYIRGRSIPNQYLIVDEAQNLSPHEIKTIVTRVGEGTKVVLTGDTDQIDSLYLDSINNGLTYVVDRLKREDIVAHVELRKGERSKLADIATKLL
jgi:PhoH-like ATPase